MNAIEIRNVTKRFKAYADRAVTLKEKMLFKKRRKYKEREILKDINLTIERGEVVGLIGENGCGKSTLLKLMTGILYPERGTVNVNGRVSSLLELGAGFHPDMSGRDNVYINAAIFGLSKKETDERFQEILDFSELHEFIDNPVRTYSSGMYTRLAFSVAINVNADILLIDEILAVGDINFQNKCFQKLDQLKKDGITIVLVTHDITVIETFCSRAIWLNNGRIAKDGESSRVAEAYKGYMNEKQARLFANGKDFDRTDVFYAYQFFLDRLPDSEQVVNSFCNAYRDLKSLVDSILSSEEFMVKSGKKDMGKNEKEELKRSFDSYRYKLRHQNSVGVDTDVQLIAQEEAEQRKRTRFGNGKVTITEVVLKDEQGQETDEVQSKTNPQFAVFYRLNEAVERYFFGISITTIDDVHCCTLKMDNSGDALLSLNENGFVTCSINGLNLVAGEYKISVFVTDEKDRTLDYISNYRTFFITSPKELEDGIISLDYDWDITKA